jgi:hypothetical protein
MTRTSSPYAAPYLWYRARMPFACCEHMSIMEMTFAGVLAVSIRKHHEIGIEPCFTA